MTYTGIKEDYTGLRAIAQDYTGIANNGKRLYRNYIRLHKITWKTVHQIIKAVIPSLMQSGLNYISLKWTLAN